MSRLNRILLLNCLICGILALPSGTTYEGVSSDSTSLVGEDVVPSVEDVPSMTVQDPVVDVVGSMDTADLVDLDAHFDVGMPTEEEAKSQEEREDQVQPDQNPQLTETLPGVIDEANLADSAELAESNEIVVENVTSETQENPSQEGRAVQEEGSVSLPHATAQEIPLSDVEEVKSTTQQEVPVATTDLIRQQPAQTQVEEIATTGQQTSDQNTGLPVPNTQTHPQSDTTSAIATSTTSTTSTTETVEMQPSSTLQTTPSVTLPPATETQTLQPEILPVIPQTPTTTTQTVIQPTLKPVGPQAPTPLNTRRSDNAFIPQPLY